MEYDPYHCHCFSIDEFDIAEFKEKLKEINFKNTIWQNDSQFEFGLVLRVDEYTQMHVKVDSEGHIEGEIEYPPDYPMEHLKQIHSYSAHYQLKEVFKVVKIHHKSKLFPPSTCLRPKIIPAKDPSHVKTLAKGVLAIGVVGAILYFLSKDDKG